MRSALAIVFALAVAGCATATTVESPKVTPQQIAFALKADYLVPQGIAAKYVGLPPCSIIRLTLCKKAAVVTEIQKANATAVLALDEAEKAVSDPAATENRKNLAIAAARGAISALAGALKTYGVE